MAAFGQRVTQRHGGARLRNLTRRSEAFQALDGSIGVPHPAPSLPQLGWTGAVRNLKTGPARMTPQRWHRVDCATSSWPGPFQAAMARAGRHYPAAAAAWPVPSRVRSFVVYTSIEHTQATGHCPRPLVAVAVVAILTDWRKCNAGDSGGCVQQACTVAAQPVIAECSRVYVSQHRSHNAAHPFPISLARC